MGLEGIHSSNGFLAILLSLLVLISQQVRAFSDGATWTRDTSKGTQASHPQHSTQAQPGKLAQIIPSDPDARARGSLPVAPSLEA
ncbi:hypothetical protein KSF_049150 [Reticulibacter mediterranei]|uniref:Uncharacterized protein n=1 Tax=Reticulibacter mediterranei TaxID=2778369 RepID=A0A8J3N209_9CHLR|nr:hypothetical protein [Reticulibacter mediterranei]GHO94867.1 hypothetical protein KSF_049150 [Reticulibacter mediterranei]